jgi:hypothetical protein
MFMELNKRDMVKVASRNKQTRDVWFPKLGLKVGLLG